MIGGCTEGGKLGAGSLGLSFELQHVLQGHNIDPAPIDDAPGRQGRHSPQQTLAASQHPLGADFRAPLPGLLVSCQQHKQPGCSQKVSPNFVVSVALNPNETDFILELCVIFLETWGTQHWGRP